MKINIKFLINYKKYFFLVIKFCLFLINTFALIILFFLKSGILRKKLVRLKYKWIKSNKNAVLLMAPHHGNLGDQAITLAEQKFLQEFLINLTIIFNLENYTNHINNNTVIFLHGGGNIGWTYSYEENNRREIIKAYPNNSIIILPQTIYFEETFKEQQKNSAEIYSNHSKLIIMTREETSYMIGNNLFKNNKNILSPDIVTYLDDLINASIIERKGALFLLRRDIEKFISNKTINKFISLMKKEYSKCVITDTVINDYINSINKSKEHVSMLLKNISSYKIVVTDRLHGMIFCALTETSCIVLKNYNHKISSSYEWFKHLDFIKMINCYDIKELKNLIFYFKNKKTKNIYNIIKILDFFLLILY